MALSENLIEQNNGQANYETSDEVYDIRFCDPKNGIILDTKAIKELQINENIFSLLPTIRITIQDQGAYFAGLNIKNGDPIFVKITPGKIENFNNEPIPYIDSEFCVQSIHCIPGIEDQNYIYTIVGIYNAQSYLNQIDTYPKTSLTTLLKSDTRTSDDMIKEVLDDTSLKFNGKISPSDKSLWTSSNITRAQFINKILDHAWVDIDDAPILYTDINGNTTYTSIGTMCSDITRRTYMNTKTYLEQLKSEHDFNEDPFLYGDIEFLNAAGPILNQGGYKVKQGVYDPYNKLSFENDDMNIGEFSFIELIQSITSKLGDLTLMGLAIGQIADGLTKGKYITTDYYNNDTKLASRSNKDAGQLERVTKTNTCTMHWLEHHDHYDVAPEHNEMIRRSFFQNFVLMMVDVHRLPDIFKKDECRPKIGHKIRIDFSNTNELETIHTGEYIIAGKIHAFTPHQSYTIKYTCVTDGTFGKGVLEQK